MPEKKEISMIILAMFFFMIFLVINTTSAYSQKIGITEYENNYLLAWNQGGIANETYFNISSGLIQHANKLDRLPDISYVFGYARKTGLTYSFIGLDSIPASVFYNTDFLSYWYAQSNFSVGQHSFFKNNSQGVSDTFVSMSFSYKSSNAILGNSYFATGIRRLDIGSDGVSEYIVVNLGNGSSEIVYNQSGIKEWVNVTSVFISAFEVGYTFNIQFPKGVIMQYNHTSTSTNGDLTFLDYIGVVSAGVPYNFSYFWIDATCRVFCDDGYSPSWSWTMAKNVTAIYVQENQTYNLSCKYHDDTGHCVFDGSCSIYPQVNNGSLISPSWKNIPYVFDGESYANGIFPVNCFYPEPPDYCEHFTWVEDETYFFKLSAEIIKAPLQLRCSISDLVYSSATTINQNDIMNTEADFSQWSGRANINGSKVGGYSIPYSLPLKKEGSGNVTYFTNPFFSGNGTLHNISNRCLIFYGVNLLSNTKDWNKTVFYIFNNSGCINVDTAWIARNITCYNCNVTNESLRINKSADRWVNKWDVKFYTLFGDNLSVSPNTLFYVRNSSNVTEFFNTTDASGYSAIYNLTAFVKNGENYVSYNSYNANTSYFGNETVTNLTINHYWNDSIYYVYVGGLPLISIITKGTISDDDFDILIGITLIVVIINFFMFYIRKRKKRKNKNIEDSDAG
jgi:hypothetical protein